MQNDYLPLLHRLYRQSPFFAWRLKRSAHAVPTHWQPQDPWRGNPDQGASLAHEGAHPEETFGEAWQRFGWLRHMREFGGNNARSNARRLILEWDETYGNYSVEAWHPELIAERLRVLVFLWGWFGESASLDQRHDFIASMSAQLYCLEQDWNRLKTEDARVGALGSMVIASLFLNPRADVTHPCKAIVKNLETLILADGGHASRQPDKHISLLKLLIELRYALASSSGWLKEDLASTLASIEEQINRMGAIARMWRLGDGEIISTIGGNEIGAKEITRILDHAGPQGKITHHAEQSGFIRLASGRSIALLNAEHLALEFSHGTQRLVVGVGKEQELSTLSLDGVAPQASSFNSETGPAEGGTLAIASHDGYTQSYGIIHTRRIFLSTGGYDLRGEDSLTYEGKPGAIPTHVIIRFHLHPKITPFISYGGKVTLGLPSNAVAWRFVFEGAKPSIEESTFTERHAPEPSKQICLTADASSIRRDNEVSIRWGFRREQRGG